MGVRRRVPLRLLLQFPRPPRRVRLVPRRRPHRRQAAAACTVPIGPPATQDSDSVAAPGRECPNLPRAMSLPKVRVARRGMGGGVALAIHIGP